MERLWAPWRLRYVEGRTPEPEGCVFCAAARADDDEAWLVLQRGEHCFSMLNAYPYANGHLMVLPYEHVRQLWEVAPQAQAEMLAVATRWTQILADRMNTSGANVGLNLGAAAGAGIEAHLHLHIVPRWHGDTNFMPVIAGTKVLPEDLPATRAKLSSAWAERDEDR